MDSLEEVFKKIGVKNPKNPSSEDMERMFQAYLRNDLDKESFKAYCATINSSITSVIDGMKMFVQSQENISKQYMDSISLILEEVRAKFRDAVSDEDRDYFWSKINELLDRMAKEAEEQKWYSKDMTKYAIGAAVIIAGIGIALLTRNTDVIKKGMESFKA